MLRKFGFVFLFLFSIQLQAVTPEQVKAALQTQTNCSSFVKVTGNKMLLGFGHYWSLGEDARSPMPNPLVMLDIEEPSRTVKIVTGDSSIDALMWNDRIFVLTFTAIEERSAETLELLASYSTHDLNRNLVFKEHATRMTLVGEKIFISHGRLGVTVFDLATRSIIQRIPLLQSQLPLESMATGIVYAANEVFVILDNYTLTVPNQEPAFRGFVVLDPETGAVRRELRGLDPGTDSVVTDGTNLLVSYYGMPLWKYTLKSMRGNKLRKPAGIYFNFGEKGHPTGAPYLDEKYLHTCYMKHPEQPPGQSTRVLRSLERAPLKI